MNYQKLDKREQKYDKTIYKNLYSIHARTCLPRGPHKCMVSYENHSEIIALNISQNIEFKHSTYLNSRDILVVIHIVLFLEKIK